MLKNSFDEVSRGRNNNFDFLRFLLASMVIFAHSFAFVNGDTYAGYDPLCHLSNGQVAFGGLAVHGFFLISGFLIAASWLSAKSWWDYAWRRALRIIPALAVVLLFCTFIVGPIATSDRAAYFRDPQTYRFLALMAMKRIKLNNVLPGVFTTNPWPNDVNGSLWTIRYEVLCYILVPMLGLIGIYRRPWMLLVAIMLMQVGAVAWPHFGLPGGEVFHILELTMFFMVGTAFFLYRAKIPRSPWLAAAALVITVAAGAVGLLTTVEPFTLAYLIFFVAFCERLPLQHFAKRGDLSYGIYLYAFPVQQLLVVYFLRLLNPYTLSFASLIVVMALATLSWHLVEKPCMKLKRLGQKRPASEVPAPQKVAAELAPAGSS